MNGRDVGSFQPLRILVMTCILLATSVRVSLADDTTLPASAPVDKNQYTLFNPTPADQLREMDTDRPNRTNTPHTIDAGHVQIETGLFDYTFDRSKDAGANTRSDQFLFGQVDVRVGVLNILELNAFINGYDLDRTTDLHAHQSTRQNGVGDLNVGGKLNLWGDDAEAKPWTTVLAIQPQFKIPTARRDVGNGHFEANVGFPFFVTLPAGFNLGLETFFSDQRNSANTSSIFSWQNTVSIDRTVIGKLDVYLEYWSSIVRQGKTQQTLDVGGIYPLTPAISLDTGVTVGLNKATPSFECLGGVSVRF